MSKDNVNHGGKRNGAGRKPKGRGNRVNLSVRVEPANKEWLRRYSEQTGISQGELIDSAIKLLGG